ncbi:MAG: phosphoheptose isomerase [Chlamydiota bacterium]|jgi:D-sedoheptulose 7-phosphate isomerase
MDTTSVLHSIEEAVQAARFLEKPESIAFIEQAASMIIDAYRRGNKLIIAGNGGSLCDAIHFAEELTGQFRHKRAALPALAIADPGHLTCVGNDMGFESVFARGVEAHAKAGDLFIALTTSGNSANLILAIAMAKKKKMQTIAFLGKSGGVMKGMADLEWIVGGFPFSDRIQEAHMAAIHIIIEQVEQTLFL